MRWYSHSAYPCTQSPMIWKPADMDEINSKSKPTDCKSYYFIRMKMSPVYSSITSMDYKILSQHWTVTQIKIIDGSLKSNQQRFNSILSLVNLHFICFKLIIIHCHSQKKRTMDRCTESLFSWPKQKKILKIIYLKNEMI